MSQTPPAPPLRIVIADDHTIFRQGLRLMVDAEPDFSVVGEADDGIAAVRAVRELSPDLLLLDLSMPRAGGLEALRELAELRLPVSTVILTAAIASADVVRAVTLGVRGVVLKDAPASMVYACLRAVSQGHYWLDGVLADVVRTLGGNATPVPERTPREMLTLRERQIIAAVLDGGTNRDIGRRLALSEQTVKNHLTNVFNKVGVSSRLELAVYAVNHGLMQQ